MEKRTGRGLVLVLLLSLCLLAVLFPGQTYAEATSFTTSGVTSPDTIKQGSLFTVAGKVRSANPISKIEVGAVSETTGQWVTGCYYVGRPGTKTYDLAKCDSALDFTILPAGGYYYRIWVHDDQGGKKRIWNAPFTVAAKSGFSAHDLTYPSNLLKGEAFTLKGTISSVFPLKRVEVGVVKKSTGKWVEGAYRSANATGKQFNISTVDSVIKFTILPAGDYYYRIWVHDSVGGKQKLVDKPFTVSEAKQETGDLFTLKNANYPVTLKKGAAFYLKGTITGRNTLKQVEVGVTNSAGTAWIDGCYYNGTNVKARTFDITAKADPAILFPKLPAGTYYYRIWVHDVKGNKERLMNQKFTVSVSGTTKSGTETAEEDFFTLSGTNYPTALKKGAAFYLKGKITGKNTLKQVKVGVVASDGKTWVEGCYYNNTSVKARTFDIAAKADPVILFPKLPEGTYYYRVFAKDTKGNQKRLMNKKFTVGSTKPAEEETGDFFTLSGANYPAELKKGAAFYLKGKITGKNTLKQVKVGVVASDGKTWVEGCYYNNTGVKARTFDIAAKADPVILFPNLPEGTYYYRIFAKDTKGNQKRLMNKKFTVGKTATGTKVGTYTLTGMVYPESSFEKGETFTAAGKIKDTKTITRVEAGIVSDTNWVKGHYYSNGSVNARTFDLAKAAPSLKVETLPAGTYRYRVWAHDADGAKRLVDRSFTVTESVSTTPAKILKYDKALIKAIGAQPYSGPCGVYSIAYARSILDGGFSKGKYETYHDKIIATYALGRYDGYAYWNAGGARENKYFLSRKQAYQTVLAEIKAGRPAIIAVQSPSTGNNHYVCAIGYVKGTTKDNVSLESFIVLDPARGTQRYMSQTNYLSYTYPQIILF